MTSFDPATFIQGLVGPVRDAVNSNLPAFKEDAARLIVRVEALAKETEATLVALANETDPNARKLLQEDIALFLPARKDSIMSIVASRLASDVQATFEAVLGVVVKAAVVAAKSFI